MQNLSKTEKDDLFLRGFSLEVEDTIAISYQLLNLTFIQTIHILSLILTKLLSSFSLLQSHLFLLPYSFLTRIFFHPCQLLAIFSDFYLHRLVLLHRLHSSSYSLFPSYSSSFYGDTSLQLGQALLGPCVLSLFYINHRTSCTSPLTLTYSILP